MTKTTENMQGVKGVISLARKINPEIGMYQEHFLNENFGYSVRLTNNHAIAMSREIAEDFTNSRTNITQDRVQKVANTFRKLK